MKTKFERVKEKKEMHNKKCIEKELNNNVTECIGIDINSVITMNE